VPGGESGRVFGGQDGLERAAVAFGGCA